MSDVFDRHASAEPLPNPSGGKKRTLWRNLFLLNLCITLLLMGLFWLPLKFVEVNEFLDSSSVEPRRGAGNAAKAQQAPEAHKTAANLLGTHYVMINATSDETWSYFDFSLGKPANIFDRSSREWDLAFRRGKIVTNSGATNKFGKGGVLDLGEVEFEAVDQVPNRPFIEDAATRTQTENEALLQWYKYNYITHKLTPRKNVYVVRTADGKYAKVQFLGFYCANKEPGCIQMRYVYQENGAPNFLKPETAKPPVASLSPNGEISGL